MYEPKQMRLVGSRRRMAGRGGDEGSRVHAVLAYEQCE